MDLKISSVGFQGKKEVLYALTKAAQKSKDIEYYNQLAIASRITTGQIKSQAVNEASMKAYMDMAVRDSEFKNVVKKATDKDLSYIKALLAKEQTEHSIVEPMKKFSEAINDVVNNNYGGKAKEFVNSLVNELLIKLKL